MSCNCINNKNKKKKKKKKKKHKHKHKHKHKNNKKNQNKNKKENKNKSGLEQFGNYKAAQMLSCVPLAGIYLDCQPCLTLVIGTCMFAICPPLFQVTRGTLPFSKGLITLSASLCCPGPSASLRY